MERRLLLVFALTFLVIILFQPLLKKYMPQTPTPAPETPAAAQPSAQPAAPSPAAPQVQVPAKGASKQAAAEAETVVENDLYRVTFTNRGGLVKSWILKTYFDEHGQPLELVSKAAEKYGYPLSLWTYDEAQRNKLNSALYLASESGNVKAPAELTFEYADQDVAVRKTFSFDHTYVVRVETSVDVKGQPGHGLPHVAGRIRRSVEPVFVCRQPHRAPVQRQDRAPRHQEDQRRRDFAGSVQLGRGGGPVFRRGVSARGRPERGHGHAAASGGRAQEREESQSPGDDQGRRSGSWRGQSSRAQRRTPLRRTQITRCS